MRRHRRPRMQPAIEAARNDTLGLWQANDWYGLLALNVTSTCEVAATVRCSEVTRALRPLLHILTRMTQPALG
jgi:hypothetical protein